ncbi:hypothetical protein Ccrd_009771 [Cynara cardunculus var. scolymus]|uniref:Uncharacterized protein n=1 Tax=Cynara cardunculus var. scolymus TaxID=59895 RepID=A0A103YMG0_CYNCS|nr:hypothetical protein Ccrd_009771 [Cynara cardunculus var. scolymus]
MENRDFSVHQSPSSVIKALSRDSSVGQSSCTYYRSTTNEGVPFDWEMQPGTPKHRPREEVIPPPTPPPAMQSPSFPRPNVDLYVESKESTPWRFWLWKKRLSKIIQRIRPKQKQKHNKKQTNEGPNNNYSRIEKEKQREPPSTPVPKNSTSRGGAPPRAGGRKKLIPLEDLDERSWLSFKDNIDREG